MLKKLALDIVEGKVFGSWMIPEDHLNSLPIIFLPLACGSKPEAAVLYQYLDKSTHKTESGFPIFTSMCYLNKDELEALKLMLEEVKNMRKQFLERT